MIEGKTTIVHEQLISLASVDFAFTNGEGFFFHSTDGGAIKYTPFNDINANAVTKTFNASDVYNNPVLAKKIFKTGTTATVIYVGTAIK